MAELSSPQFYLPQLISCTLLNALYPEVRLPTATGAKVKVKVGSDHGFIRLREGDWVYIALTPGSKVGLLTWSQGWQEGCHGLRL